MPEPVISVSVREAVEFALLSGSLLPGAQLARMREGTQGHLARQRALPGARAEVAVKGRVKGEGVSLLVGGRIDLLYEREGLPVVEEVKLAPGGDSLEAAVPVHRAQAVCYAHLLGAGGAIVRVAYVTRDGEEARAFEETLQAERLRAEFGALLAPFLRRAEAQARWRALRDASLRALPFPYGSFRQGQREMAAQAYWAVKLGRRLFAQAPTGTGKTAAALFPALKALGEGKTGQIFYLTARATAQRNAAAAIERMRGGGLRLRSLVMTAKEKLCFRKAAADGGPPGKGKSAWRCDVLACPFADGFYDRLPGALEEIRQGDDWSREAVEAAARAHGVCPFEFSLSLCEEADLVVGDYNYAFDPAARIRRVFQWTSNVTLLVDEAHNLPDRAREMLSAELDSGSLRGIRREAGRLLGRRAELYRALTGLINWTEAREEGARREAPEGLASLVSACGDAALSVAREVPLYDLPRTLAAVSGTLDRFDRGYATLALKEASRSRVLFLCLDPGPHLREATRKLRGAVFFSATLTPLAAWRDAMGGVEGDGLLSLPSPFPEENFLVLRYGVSTRYRARERTAGAVAEAILAMIRARPGNYLACFPSYAYLDRVRAAIEAAGTDARLHVQRGNMGEAERAAYLEAFAPRTKGALLGMVVLGGLFGEGVDLPGERLSGVAVVGVGLPMICPERELLRAYYAEVQGDGFPLAYQYPGMNKVLQAVGRVIRSESDRGVALLIDDRFLLQTYANLMPPWWGEAALARDPADIRKRMEAFWRHRSTT